MAIRLTNAEARRLIRLLDKAKKNEYFDMREEADADSKLLKKRLTERNH